MTKNELNKYLLSTGSEDKPQVEAAINIIYQLMGKSLPKIIWAESPKAALVTLINIKLDNYTQRVKNGLDHKNVHMISYSTWIKAYQRGESLITESIGPIKYNKFESILDNSNYYHHIINDTIQKTKNAGLFFNPYQLHREYRPMFSGTRDLYFIAIDEKKLKKLNDYPLAKNVFNSYMMLEGMFIWPMNTICIVSDRPISIHYDASFRLHNVNGPAVEFSDGYKFYALNGVAVTSNLIEEPESITYREIINQHNLEIQRLMIEKMGREAFITNMKLKKIDESEFGTLFKSGYTRRTWMQIEDIPEEDRHKSVARRQSAGMIKYNLHFVEVTNHSPEPDGSYRKFFIQVSPFCKTAKSACAWTFRLAEKDYNPIIQT